MPCCDECAIFFLLNWWYVRRIHCWFDFDYWHHHCLSYCCYLIPAFQLAFQLLIIIYIKSKLINYFTFKYFESYQIILFDLIIHRIFKDYEYNYLNLRLVIESNSKLWDLVNLLSGNFFGLLFHRNEFFKYTH